MTDVLPGSLLPQILDTIERMTAGRERAQLDMALTEAALRLLGARSVRLHRIQERDGEPVVWLVAAARPGQSRLHDDGFAPPDARHALSSPSLLHRCHAGGIPVFDGESAAFPLLDGRGTCTALLKVTGMSSAPAQIATLYELLAIYRNLQSLLDDCELDTLTGLLNRKTFDNSLTRILSRTAAAHDRRRNSHGLPQRRQRRVPRSHHWFGLIDIDHFKRINDQYGHSIGDEVLLLLADMMKANFRDEDRLFRFGGEEFVILLMPAEQVDAQLAFERYRSAVSARVFPLVGRVTVSIGYARISATDQASTIFDRADDALYWVKENGRNQTRSYESLIAENALQQRRDKPDIEFF